jgi:hypothetical protein
MDRVEEDRMDRKYEKPVVKELGSPRELTLQLQSKDHNSVSDGVQFLHENINEAS